MKILSLYTSLPSSVAIIDNNSFQQTGSNETIMDTQSLKNKWESFGWNTFELDGHDVEKLHSFFSKTNNTQKPTAIIAKTIKGKGFSFSENNNDWHHSVLTKKLYDTAIEELKLI